MGLLKTAVVLLSALALALPASARIYCCNDNHGRRICGDILPAECQVRAYDEFNAQGVLKKKHDAPLTPEQRAEREAEEARKKAEEHAAAEQARQDKAMLASYTSVDDIDAKRERTIAGAKADIRTAEERLDDAKERIERLKKSAARYDGTGKPMPATLKSNLRDSEADLAARQKALEDKKHELISINERFDRDRKRFVELTSQPRLAEPVIIPPPR